MANGFSLIDSSSSTSKKVSLDCPNRHYFSALKKRPPPIFPFSFNKIFCSLANVKKVIFPPFWKESSTINGSELSSGANDTTAATASRIIITANPTHILASSLLLHRHDDANPTNGRCPTQLASSWYGTGLLVCDEPWQNETWWLLRNSQTSTPQKKNLKMTYIGFVIEKCDGHSSTNLFVKQAEIYFPYIASRLPFIYPSLVLWCDQ